MNVPHPDPSPPGPPHPDPERLVMAALPAEPDDPAVAAHLRGCLSCRAEVDDLRRTVELAREGGDSLGPGGGVGDALPPPPDHVWRGIVAELGLAGERNGQVGGPHTHLGPPGYRKGGGDVAGGGHMQDVTSAPRARPAAARRRRRVLVPVLAATIGLLAGLGVDRALAPEPGLSPVAGPLVRLAPVGGLDPAASGTVAMADDRGERRMVVQVQGVTNIDDGDHLEAWLMDASGTRLVPLGALDGGDGDFHGTFALPDSVPLGVFDRVDVSAERWDGNPAHSTLSVLRGDL